MYFTREIESKIIPQLEKKEILVLVGMRRTGKTTLLKMLYEKIDSDNKLFLDLQNLLEQRIFKELDYNNILNNLKPYGINHKEKIYLFIDEIQFMPEVTQAIKYIYDHYNIKFVITGSSSFYLKNLFPESLAGRKVVFNLFPLTFNEFLTFKNIDLKTEMAFSEKSKSKNLIEFEQIQKYYDEYQTFGGFPQVVIEEDKAQKELLLTDIFNSYFQIDILTLSDFKKLEALKNLIFLLMERVGSKLDISKLASLVKVSRETVYSYLNLLEGSYFIHLISPFTLNRDREVSGSKKVYVCDSGLLNLLSKVSAGSLFENSVFNNLKKYGGINYYQKRSGQEIDFILDEKIAFEAKITADDKDIWRLKKLSDKLEINEYYLIGKNFLNHNNYIPFYKL